MAEPVIRINQSTKPIRITGVQGSARIGSPGTSGEANLGANVGAGEGLVFRDKVGATLNFRSFTGTGGIVVAVNGDVIEIDGSGIAGGEDNLGANVGGGDANVFRNKTGVTLNLRTISGTGGIAVSENGDVIEIDGSAISPAGTATFLAFFDAAGALADSVVFVDNAAAPTKLTVPLDLLITGIQIQAPAFDINVTSVGADWRFTNSANIIQLSIGGQGQLNSGPGQGHTFQSQEPDSGTAVGYLVQTGVLDSTSFTPGARHSCWEDSNGVALLALAMDGLLDFITPDALGGGAAPTLGTIGGTGPATAAQSKWLQITINGTNHWIPAWV